MADYPNGIADGHGNDLILYDGDTVNGNFVNMGHVIIKPGAVVKIKDASQPSLDSGAYLRIWAKSISVMGILDGSGQGFAGGGGGGANYSLTSAYGSAGAGGIGGSFFGGNGQHGAYLTAGGQKGSIGGTGGGPEAYGATASGGLPGAAAVYQEVGTPSVLNGGHGGYLGLGVNADTSIDESIYSGAGGAGGSSSIRQAIITVGSWNIAAGAAGGQGGYGGTSIAFYSRQIVVGPAGQILSNAVLGGGAGGSNGVAGAGGGGNGAPGVTGGGTFVGGTGGTKGLSGYVGTDGPGLYLCGSAGDAGKGGWMSGYQTNQPPASGYDLFRGGDGGLGAGGGILFKIYPSLTCGPQIIINGKVDNYGGLGATNGGTFKCFYTGNALIPTVNINTGRLFTKKLTKGVSIM